jgi:UDP-N-acetylmuramoylalanine--D-glutamate ligase
VGELGVRDGQLVDRAFADDLVLLPAASIPVPGPVGVLDALAAAALARSVGVPAEAIAAAVASFRVGPHRSEVVGVVDGIRYVDDSKATNPHAAEASLLAYPRVVWIAGGQLKGTSVDDLVIRIADRLAGVVLLGVDADVIAAAFDRHAPDVPRIAVPGRNDGAMDQAVRAASTLAQPGDVVLLAPAAASLDMFTSYAARGDAFCVAVAALRGREVGG